MGATAKKQREKKFSLCFLAYSGAQNSFGEPSLDMYTPRGYSLSMKKGICHKDKLVALRRIEGQVRGIQKMIDDERYCVDILNAMGAILGALKRVETNILKDHLNACATKAFHGKSRKEKDEKLKEIFGLLENLRR